MKRGFIFLDYIKVVIIRLFLCEARRQIRSIVELCEEFEVRRSRVKSGYD